LVSPTLSFPQTTIKRGAAIVIIVAGTAVVAEGCVQVLVLVHLIVDLIFGGSRISGGHVGFGEHLLERRPVASKTTSVRTCIKCTTFQLPAAGSVDLPRTAIIFTFSIPGPGKSAMIPALTGIASARGTVAKSTITISLSVASSQHAREEEE
jgi:hypothetical protein